MSAEVRLGWNNSRLIAGARGADAIVQNFANRTRSVLSSVGTGLGQGIGQELFQRLSDGAQRAFGSIAQATIEADSMRLGMTALEGSVESAVGRLKEMRDLAKSPGLGFGQAVDADIKLRSVGLSADLSRKAIEEMGNALAVVGKGKADLDGVLLAITQIVSKGKISAEELNQIAERVPQIRKVLKDTFGTADSEELQKLGIPVERFISLTVDGFSRTIPRALVGLQGKIDNTTDALTARLADFGTAVLENMVDPFDEASDAFERSEMEFKAAGATIGQTLNGLAALAKSAFSVVQFSLDGWGQLTAAALRLVTGIERDEKAFMAAELAAQRYNDELAETARQAQDLKRHQDAAALATKAYAEAQLEARQRAIDLAKAQREVAEKTMEAAAAARSAFMDERSSTTNKIISDEDKLAQAKESVLTIERDLAKVIGQKGGEELTYKLLQEREKVMAEILDLSKAISTQQDEANDEVATQRDEADRIASLRKYNLLMLDTELALIDAQNAGMTRKAEQMARAMAIAERTLEIHRETGLSIADAQRRAEQLVDAERRAEQTSGERGRIQGYSQERQGGAEEARARAEERVRQSQERSEEARKRGFGGLDEHYEKQKTRLDETFRTPGLDAYNRLQDRSRPVGAPMPAADKQPNQPQELPTVEQLLSRLIEATEGLKES